MNLDQNLFAKAFELPDGQECQIDRERFMYHIQNYITFNL
jgi:hypothetical protein